MNQSVVSEKDMSKGKVLVSVCAVVAGETRVGRSVARAQWRKSKSRNKAGMIRGH